MQIRLWFLLFYVTPYVCVAAAILSETTAHWGESRRIAALKLATMAWLLIPAIAGLVRDLRGRRAP